MLLIDNSCGLDSADCDALLQGVGELIWRISDDSDTTRVQTMLISDKGHPTVLVPFDDDALQRDTAEYVEFVRQHGQCSGGGDGKTDAYKALSAAIDALDSKDDRVDRIIVVSACRDDRKKVCKKLPQRLSQEHIDVYVVNLIDASEAANVIGSGDASEYLKCIADDDSNRVCPGYDAHGVTVDEFTGIIEDCLLPGICPDPAATNPPTQWPSFVPTEDPTPKNVWLTPKPTPKPTAKPTAKPTEKPTAAITGDDHVCCAAAGELQGMTCRCRRSCAGAQCEEGTGFAFDGQPKCTGKGVCCCGDVCNKKERPEFDTCAAY